LFEEERQNKIKRCIQKRKEMIDSTKKPKDYVIKNNENEEKNNDKKKTFI
jgi:hypothetical protein